MSGLRSFSSQKNNPGEGRSAFCLFIRLLLDIGLCPLWGQKEQRCCGHSWTHFHVGRCFPFLAAHAWGCAVLGRVVTLRVTWQGPAHRPAAWLLQR